MQRAKSEYAIQAVTNALRVLQAFEATEQLGVTELSRRLSLHKNNVFRILATLEESGWIEQTDDDEYRLGGRCVRLSQAYSKARQLTRYARPVLEAVSQEAGETAHLAVLRDFEAVHLDGEQSTGLLVTTLRIGARLPCHCTALGKILLACGPRETLEAYDRVIIAPGGIAARTPNTLTDRDKLLDELQQVGTQGFALDLEECERGIHCIASPVYDGTARLVAALSISAPSLRVDRDGLESRVRPLLEREAADLSRRLGLCA